MCLVSVIYSSQSDKTCYILFIDFSLKSMHCTCIYKHVNVPGDFVQGNNLRHFFCNSLSHPFFMKLGGNVDSLLT